jgi:hypothetical protein
MGKFTNYKIQIKSITEISGSHGGDYEGYTALWDLTSCSLVVVISIDLMIEAVRTSETSVSLNVTTRRYVPEDSKL